jgi:hypothetical protein
LKQISHEIFSDFLPSEAEISDDRGVSGGATEISDTFFESLTLGLQKKKKSFDNI